MDRLRLLALHGYHGSAEILRAQASQLAAAISPLAELVYVDAPSLAVNDHGWWHAVTDRDAPYYGGRVEEQSLVPLGDARIGRIGLDQWLAEAKKG